MFSIRKIFKDSYALYINKFTVVIGVTALVYFLTVLFDEVVENILGLNLILGICIGVLLGVINIIIKIGYIKYFLKLLSGGFPTLEDLLAYTHLLWRYVVSGVLLTLVIGAGLIFFVIPGIYFALRFMFVPIIILDKEVTVKEAFKRSTKLTEGIKWKLLGLGVLLTLIQGLVSALLFSHSGPLIYGAGFVLMSPFLTIVFLTAYRTTLGLE